LFKVKYQTDQALAGTYSLKLTAFYSNYPDNKVDSPIFSVKIVDPCETPTLNLPTTLKDQTRTITDPSSTYTFNPLFTVSPSFCDAAVSISVSGAAASYV